MEEKFLDALFSARKQAEELGVHFRPLEREKAMEQVHWELSGHRDSDGFPQLQRLGRLELTVEALSVKGQFTALFSDEEANNALMRLMDAGYGF